MRREVTLVGSVGPAFGLLVGNPAEAGTQLIVPVAADMTVVPEAADHDARVDADT